MNQKAAISKELNAKHTKILEGLLKLPENRECADCKNKAPRWASINLGIFICLQCSGIHRSLGVHISKVRSATLDTWLPEQVAYMQRVGNEKSNAYWEAELPLHYDKSRFENFIREKYVDRRWVPKDGKVKSPPSSEDGLASPHSSKSESSCSITEFLANQKIIKEYPQVEKETCLKTELTSVDQSLTSMSSNSITDLATDTGNPEVHKKGSEDQTTQVASNDSQITEQSVLKDQSAATATATATATAVPVVQPSKVDYATELFRMLCVDDSADSDSSPSSTTSAWVDFDTDEEETVKENIVLRSSDNKVHPEPKIGDVRTSMVPETKEFPREHQKYATSHNQGLVQEPNTASGISYHGTTASLQGIHQQPVTTSQAPYLNGRMTNTINQSPGTHLQMLNIPPGKFAKSTASYTTSSLYKPAVAVNGLSTNPAKTPPAALPVSGYDYDFSFLTQGMFTK